MSEQTKTCPFCVETIHPSASRCPHCTQRQPDAPGLHRDVPGRLVGGVCAAVAAHFGWDGTLMRVLFVVSLAITGGALVWAYALLWFLTPFELAGRSPATKLLDGLTDLFKAPASAEEPTEP